MGGLREGVPQRMKNMKTRSGWTIVETMIVVAIIMLLVAILFPSYLKVKGKMQNESSKELRPTSSGLVAYWLDGHKYVIWVNGGVLHAPDCPCMTNSMSEINL